MKPIIWSDLDYNHHALYFAEVPLLEQTNFSAPLS